MTKSVGRFNYNTFNIKRGYGLHERFRGYDSDERKILEQLCNLPDESSDQ
ncbi:MAG: hypothetical protein P0116_12685 [Candidatus Nitrosocosmicus sp.]|nr:hypothetical protein [Candidatus Nitrosocosmicus sp.]